MTVYPLGDELDSPIAAEIANLSQRRKAADMLPYPLPKVTRIISVANQKGGVGKTTTAVNVAAALAFAGARVLLVDLDPQGNASMAMGHTPAPDQKGIYEAIMGNAGLGEVIYPAQNVPNLSYIPANIHLSAAEVELAGVSEREFRLRNVFSNYFSQGNAAPHYIIIDCPPSLGMLTINALSSTTELLIPVQCEYYALEGLSQLLNTMNMVHKQLNSRLTAFNMLLTLFDSRTRLANDVVEEVYRHFPGKILNTKIPRTVRLAEAPGYGKTVIDFDRSSLGSLAYREAASELALRDPGILGSDNG